MSKQHLTPEPSSLDSLKEKTDRALEVLTTSGNSGTAAAARILLKERDRAFQTEQFERQLALAEKQRKIAWYTFGVAIAAVFIATIAPVIELVKSFSGN